MRQQLWDTVRGLLTKLSEKLHMISLYTFKLNLFPNKLYANPQILMYVFENLTAALVMGHESNQDEMYSWVSDKQGISNNNKKYSTVDYHKQGMSEPSMASSNTV